ncbi:MAG: hypothetical protein MUF34_31720 [Polyangiaceae bacterium]|nr:hypothetical protein [Polyangiaceae bacterium]
MPSPRLNSRPRARLASGAALPRAARLGSALAALPRAARLGSALAALAAPAPALAAPPGEGHESLYVLQLADHDALPQARALSTALRQRVHESKEYALGNSTSSLEALASRCVKAPLVSANGGFREPARPCQEQIGTSLRMGTLMPKPPYVWGLLYRSASPPSKLILRVHLWREGQEDALVEQPYDEALIDPKNPALVDLSDYLFQRLLHGDEIGRARVTAPAGVGGELWVDNEARGRLEPGGTRELTLPRGSHAFELRGGGRVLGAARQSVGAGPTAEVSFASASAASVDGGFDERPPPSLTDEEGARPGPKRSSSALPWVFGGIGVAGLVAAGVFLGQERSASSDLDRLCADQCPNRAQDAIDKSQLYGTLWPVALGVGVAGLGAGAYFLLKPNEKPAAARAPWRLVGTFQPIAGGAAAGVSGSF